MTAEGPGSSSPSMSDTAVQIIARGPRAAAEAAAAAVDAHPALETATYSILEEDEDRDVWRIDAYPVADEEAEALRAVLAGFPALTTQTEVLADADWLAMALSGLPPVRGLPLVDELAKVLPDLDSATGLTDQQERNLLDTILGGRR